MKTLAVCCLQRWPPPVFHPANTEQPVVLIILVPVQRALLAYAVKNCKYEQQKDRDQSPHQVPAGLWSAVSLLLVACDFSFTQAHYTNSSQHVIEPLYQIHLAPYNTSYRAWIFHNGCYNDDLKGSTSLKTAGIVLVSAVPLCIKLLSVQKTLAKFMVTHAIIVFHTNSANQKAHFSRPLVTFTAAYKEARDVFVLCCLNW